MIIREMSPLQFIIICVWSFNHLPGNNGDTICIDSIGVRCQEPLIKQTVCKDMQTGPELCAKTCGICPTTSTIVTMSTTQSGYITTHKTTSLTVTGLVAPLQNSTCMDASYQCSDKYILSVICNDEATATTLCAKSCGRCVTAPTTSITTSMKATKATQPTKKPTAETTTTTILKQNRVCADASKQCNNQLVLSVICNDTTTAKQLCAKSCGFCVTTPTTTQTTTTTKTTPIRATQQQKMCTDASSQCADQTILSVICHDNVTAGQMCAKSCGLCETTPTTRTTTKITTVGTTQQRQLCSDVSSQCSDQTILSVICNDTVTAGKLCAKSCGLCAQRVTIMSSSLVSTTTSTCSNDPTAHCDPKMSSFICSDIHFSKFCKKLCGICGKSTGKTPPLEG